MKVGALFAQEPGSRIRCVAKVGYESNVVGLITVKTFFMEAPFEIHWRRLLVKGSFV